MRPRGEIEERSYKISQKTINKMANEYIPIPLEKKLIE